MNIRFKHLWSRLILLTAAASPLLAQTPSVFIDGPAPYAVVSGTITVSGWAIDNTTTNLGTAIASVTVQVDGATAGSATMGISRPDVCDAYPARPGCPNVGWAYSLDTTKLAPGSHNITVLANDANFFPTTGSATVPISIGNLSTGPQAVPMVAIDAPTAGSVVAGTINVSGWAIDAQTSAATAISSVQVFVDGAIVGNASYGLARPDVCSSHPGAPSCPNVGYTFALNTSNYAAGAHTLTVVATDSDGNPDSGTATSTFSVATAAPAVLIDSVTSGAVVSGSVTVSGWAISNTGSGNPIAGVNILVDGTQAGAATYGTSRPDVCALYPTVPSCPNVGFSYVLNTKTLTPGSHTLTAVATDGTFGSAGSWTINITVVALLTVTIETPLPGSTSMGNVVVSGWALDTTNTSTGTAITSVQVSIDGLPLGSAVYGISRPDVCALFPGGAGCPNVGFTYNLDTTSLSPGSHTVNVLARDSSSPQNSAASNVTFNLGSSHSFNLDTPANGSTVSGVVNVSGWAIAPAGTQINAIKVYVDGNQVGLGNYGLSRPDVCAAYPGSNGCPNVGFSFSLDTSTLTASFHTLTVVVSTSDGAQPVGTGAAVITVIH